MNDHMPNDRTFSLSTIVIGVAATLLLPATTACADDAMTLTARLAQPIMKSGEKQQNFLRVGLDGCKPEPNKSRAPVNVVFVIDRSGSMAGSRLAQAREAAVMAASRLGENDIASLIAFDDKVEVMAPARKLTDRDAFTRLIRQIDARGSTAIFAGVTEGASEVRKFKDARYLNRIVLLSDGIANVGPSRPADFTALGRALLTEGISVTTIGLGADYNEDLMQQLARASDGNHAFASAPNDLIQIFNREFDDVLASCAQMVSIDIELNPGVRAVRALSRDGTIEGGHAKFRLNQVYAATEHYILLELEASGQPSKDEQDWGQVHVAYTASKTGAPGAVDAAIRGRFSASEAEVTASRDRTVMESVLEQVTRERAQQAVALRDRGLVEEARSLFRQNVTTIHSYLATAGETSPLLQALESQYGNLSNIAPAAAPAQWNQQRKELRQLDARSPAAAASAKRY